MLQMLINSIIFLLWSALIVYVSERRLVVGQPLLNYHIALRWVIVYGSELLWSSCCIFLLVLDMHSLVTKSWCWIIVVFIKKLLFTNIDVFYISILLSWCLLILLRIFLWKRLHIPQFCQVSGPAESWCWGLQLFPSFNSSLSDFQDCIVFIIQEVHAFIKGVWEFWDDDQSIFGF